MVITLARQCGCNGDYIANKLSKYYGIPCYDKYAISEIAKSNGTYEKYPDFLAENQANAFLSSISDDLESGFIRKTPENALKPIIDSGNCIIIGRCGNYVFRNNADAVRIYISADKSERINVIQNKHNVNKRKAEIIVEETDLRRAEYHEYYTGEKWGFAGNYDLCLNESRLGIDGVLYEIEHYIALLNINGNTN